MFRVVVQAIWEIWLIPRYAITISPGLQIIWLDSTYLATSAICMHSLPPKHSAIDVIGAGTIFTYMWTRQLYRRSTARKNQCQDEDQLDRLQHRFSLSTSVRQINYRMMCLIFTLLFTAVMLLVIVLHCL